MYQKQNLLYLSYYIIIIFVLTIIIFFKENNLTPYLLSK